MMRTANGDLSERLIAGAVRGFVTLWCLPALVVAYAATLTMIAIWRTVLLVEGLVRLLFGSIDGSWKSIAATPPGGLDLRVGRELPR
jgi:hypothetical protein